MTKDEYRKAVGALRNKYQKSINDLYIWCSLAVESLGFALKDNEFLSVREFSVPSKQPEKTVKRTKEQVIKIITSARDRELYESVFTYLVAQGEAFIQDILKQTLIFDEKKLKTRVSGVDHLKKIDVTEIIDRKSRKDIIEAIIEKEMISLFYAKPSAQFEYLEKVVDVEVEEPMKESWAEIKATRDLLVHNSGTINKLYIRKAGKFARGKEGERVTIDREYIEQSMSMVKSIVGRVCSRIQRNCKSKA